MSHYSSSLHYFFQLMLILFLNSLNLFLYLQALKVGSKLNENVIKPASNKVLLFWKLNWYYSSIAIINIYFLNLKLIIKLKTLNL